MYFQFIDLECKELEKKNDLYFPIYKLLKDKRVSIPIIDLIYDIDKAHRELNSETKQQLLETIKNNLSNLYIKKQETQKETTQNEQSKNQVIVNPLLTESIND